MRHFIAAVGLWVLIGGLIAGTPTVHAQSYPSRPVQLIITIPAGGGGDVNARTLTEELGKNLGTQVVPINKPGAADTLGTEAIARSRKDGYTIGYTSSAAMVYARIINPENIHYDPIKDFDHLGLHVFFPIGLAVQESSPWKTFSDFIDYAKKNPGKIRISTPGLGSTAHFNLELIQSLTGTQLTHIPFKGGESVITALLGGHVEATLDALGKIIPHAEAGKMRVLLLSKKFSQFPSVPTIPELGYHQDLLSAWFAFFAPSSIPEEARKVLVPAVERAIKSPGPKAIVERRGYLVDYRTPAELKKIMASDYDTARVIAAKVGLGKQ